MYQTVLQSNEEEIIKRFSFKLYVVTIINNIKLYNHQIL